MTRFDLRHYGLDLILESSTNLNSLYTNAIYRAKAESGVGGNVQRITLNGAQYNVVKQLGSGTYGTTYKVVSNKDGQEYAIKQISGVETPYDINNMLKESIIQILLAHVSYAEETGPYVPHLYEIGYDIFNKMAYIRSELMTNTFWNIVGSSSPKENDLIVPDALTQVAKILDFFNKTLQFNHRDMKGDNVMYVLTPEGNPKYRLIDFGFSCITWNGLKINGGGYFAQDHKCYVQHRDLSQLMYYICKYVPISKKLQTELRSLLVANVEHKECMMLEKCAHIKEWTNVYNFLDSNNVNVPKGIPSAVIDTMGRFVKPAAYSDNKVEEPKKICPQGKVLNPKTGRCIKDKGDTHTAPGECPPGKIMNPATKRCVNVDGVLGKRLLAKQGLPKELAKSVEELLKPAYELGSPKPQPKPQDANPFGSPKPQPKPQDANPLGSPKQGRFQATRKFFRKLLGKKSKRQQTRKA